MENIETQCKMKQCNVCRDNFIQDDVINMCSDKSHESLCYQCAKDYINHKILSNKTGMLSLMYCPSTHSDGKRRILNYSEYSKFISPELLNALEKNSSSLLSITCGGCHTLRSIAQVTSIEQMNTAKADIENKLFKKKGNSLVNDFIQDLQKYETNELNVDEFYDKLSVKYFSNLQIGSDIEAFNMLIPILLCILDPERRTTLHLRFLREHPRVLTNCCRREHCFKCKTKEWHSGKTCEENTNTLANEIIDCPSCNLYLTKSDGCNTVSCVCGKQFSWSVEKDLCERALIFERKYKTIPNIAKVCSQIICTENHPDLGLAKAFQTRHKVEVDRELLKVFEIKYSPYPAAALCVLNLSKLSEGIRECAIIYENAHTEEVAAYRSSIMFAKESMFLTLFPAKERAFAAIRLLGLGNFKKQKNFPYSNDITVIESARIWVEKNKFLIDEESKSLECRNVQRFIDLYGNSKISTKAISEDYFCPSLEFNMATSNTALTFSDGNTKVTRVGSISCYPAAFADLNSPRSIFTVCLEKAPTSPNWLTFGLSKKGMPSASSDGVGRTVNSWGLCDDRGSNNLNGNEKTSRVCSCGVDVAITRKVKQGDVLECLVDCMDGYCEIYNNRELIYKFDIPRCSHEEYQFSMTFANDHSAAIISSLSKRSNIYGVISLGLNIDHYELYDCFKRLLRSLTNNYNSSLFSKDFIIYYSNFFESIHKGKDLITIVQGMLNTIDLLLHKKAWKNEFQKNLEITWSEILGVACFYHLNQEVIEKERMETLSLKFLNEYGSNASFCAANILANNNEFGETFQAAKAFVQLNPTIMNDWYDYNLSMDEPLINNFKDIGCICLPRCTSICTKSSVEQANKIKSMKKGTS